VAAADVEAACAMIDVECPPATTTPVEFESGSFRDRSSRVFLQEGRVYRALSEAGLADWEQVSQLPFFPQAMQDGKIVHSFRMSQGAGLADAAPEDLCARWAGVLQHDRIPFVSYPYEWCFSMLRDAALLHLELMAAALDEAFILKDASAFNVQWNGVNPVFIDVGSFTRHPAGQPWLAYRQFCQMFLYPLMLQAYRKVDFQPWLRGALDGIPPAQFLNLLSMRDLFRRGVFSHGWLHAKLESGFGSGNNRVSDSLQSSGFQRALIQNNVRKLTALIRGLRSRPQRSSWTGYRDEAASAQSDGDAKAEFVSSIAYSRPWSLVWDLGCNTGRFSRIVAENAQYVVAVDSDPACIEDLYQTLRRERTPHILPLINNLADPSPALGWRGKERQTLPERGRPELTICLALVHHLVIGANVLLTELLDWLAGLKSHLVIEFVDKADPMVRALLRNKADQYADYSQEAFERGLEARFEVLRRQPLPSQTRTLYYAAPRC
jgi:hypothetical protein